LNGAHGNGEPLTCGKKKPDGVSKKDDPSPSLPYALIFFTVSANHVENSWRQKSNFSNFCLLNPQKDGSVRNVSRALLFLPSPAYFNLKILQFLPRW
jgi:hypothetical protein